MFVCPSCPIITHTWSFIVWYEWCLSFLFFRSSMKGAEYTTYLQRWSEAPSVERRCVTWGLKPGWSWSCDLLLSPDCRRFTLRTTVTSCPTHLYSIVILVLRYPSCKTVIRVLLSWATLYKTFFLKRQWNVFTLVCVFTVVCDLNHLWVF